MFQLPFLSPQTKDLAKSISEDRRHRNNVDLESKKLLSVTSNRRIKRYEDRV